MNNQAWEDSTVAQTRHPAAMVQSWALIFSVFIVVVVGNNEQI